MRGLRDRGAAPRVPLIERHFSPQLPGRNSGVFVVRRPGIETTRVSTLDVTGARRIALRLVLGQAVATLAVAAAFLVFSGSTAARSALLGGAIGVAASLAMTLIVFGRGPSDPKRIARSFFRGEAVKLGLTVLLFAVVLQVFAIAVAPFFVAYAATYVVFWIALLKLH